MSSVDSLSASPTSEYYLLATSVVFYYDFLLTFPQEIKHVWSKFNIVNTLVVMLRYITAFTYIPIFVIAFAPAFSGDEKCGEFRKFPGIMGLICQGITSIFLIIRLYAIFDRSRWILGATVPFAIVNFILSSLALWTAKVAIISNGVVTLPDLRGASGVSSYCFPMPDFSPGSQSLSLYRLSYFSILLFDTLVFILALLKMGRLYQTKRLHMSNPSSIVLICFRDGILFFAILTISNLFNLIIFMRFFSGAKSDSDIAMHNGYLFVVSSGTNSELTHALSVILVSRMIFNLREAGTEVLEGTEMWCSRIERDATSVRFLVPPDDFDE